jgi:hypothetical protein
VLYQGVDLGVKASVSLFISLTSNPQRNRDRAMLRSKVVDTCLNNVKTECHKSTIIGDSFAEG